MTRATCTTSGAPGATLGALVRPAAALCAAAAAAALLPPAAAIAGPAEPAPGQPDLWATVDVCDTPRHPDTVGIRASMPGRPPGTALGMRFHIQYRRPGGWSDAAGADSGWRRLGVAAGTAAESGWSFAFARPRAAVTLRGAVDVRWRRAGRTVRAARVVTEGGHRPGAGADPPGYSAATCVLGG